MNCGEEISYLRYTKFKNIQENVLKDCIKDYAKCKILFACFHIIVDVYTIDELHFFHVIHSNISLLYHYDNENHYGNSMSSRKKQMK